ncbi:glycosyltransferase [Sphingobacterium sp. SGL-16]|jgi:mannosyltransferase OCH1-like enzyme|uniref:glycosyltransferase n=1 Tax=Sphingobacterium sp. SGL-16 TaxID=2710883 RepID=UPI0013EB9A7F|nr:glycosyltransferase [Sphingobacterium sp. SGL-16]NGM72629.1 hypothetical protein [Sphingobacterium sp. SGL-16]
MIPKLLHFCWYGKGEYNDTIRKCIRSWEEKMPDYKIVKWDESNTPFAQMPFLQVLYRQKRWAFISDYMRLYALYKQGGIYFDTDVEVIKSFDDLLSEPSFIAFQVELGTDKYPFNTAVIGGEKGNAFIEKCLRESEKLLRMYYHAMAAPKISSRVLLENYGVSRYEKQKFEDVTVLTRDYFYPFSWREEYSEDCLTNNSLAIHWWEDSWGNKKKNLKYYWTSFSRKAERTPGIIASRLKWVFQKTEFFLYKKIK